MFMYIHSDPLYQLAGKKYLNKTIFLLYVYYLKLKSNYRRFIFREYIDLNRNQLILKELVSRRGLPVLDNIPLGLQRTKDILSGIRDPPSKISSILE